MDIYAEIEQKRIERRERRQKRIQREERRERILMPIKLIAEILLATAFVYLYMLYGFLWATA